MDAIEHKGFVESIHENTMRVRIEQASSCSACNAKSICSSADKQEKWIDIPFFTGKYSIGQTVTVVGQASIGLKAVALAYLIPLILMMLGLAISSIWLFPGNDGLAALIALSITILYYISLYPFRKIIQSRFVFTVKPFDENSSMESDGNKNTCL